MDYNFGISQLATGSDNGLITLWDFENMKIEDVVNNNSKFETEVYIEKIIEEAKKGDKIQLERRGYCIIDSLRNFLMISLVNSSAPRAFK